MSTDTTPTHETLVAQDHAHLWHPFTPMRQWREKDPLIIDHARGFELVDTTGKRYIDGVSSLWCNVHGHRVPELDQAVRDQLDKVAHTTMLGQSNPAAIQLAERLVELTGRHLYSDPDNQTPRLNKVFYSDAGATALEVAFKMAIGYWYNNGQPQRNRFIGLAGAYHGDTTGAMAVGYSELFHRAFRTMLFDIESFPAPDPCRPPENFAFKADCGDCGLTGTASHCHGQDDRVWPSECEAFNQALRDHCLTELAKLLTSQGDRIAAVVIEPLMQGAAGMVCQPPGFVRGVRRLCDKFGVLLIADEVATGFGRTGAMFACAHDRAAPDLLCVAKGLTGGYLPVAATLATDEVYNAFTGDLAERKTLYHGHTYTGNPLGCAAALATLKLFDENHVIEHSRQSAKLITEKLNPLRDHPHILDIRQRGLMVGIELCRKRPQPGQTAEPFDFAAQVGHRFCASMLDHGVWIRPLGNVLILMPAPAMDHDTLGRMLDAVVEQLLSWAFPAD